MLSSWLNGRRSGRSIGVSKKLISDIVELAILPYFVYFSSGGPTVYFLEMLVNKSVEMLSNTRDNGFSGTLRVAARSDYLYEVKIWNAHAINPKWPSNNETGTLNSQIITYFQ